MKSGALALNLRVLTPAETKVAHSHGRYGSKKAWNARMYGVTTALKI